MGTSLAVEQRQPVGDTAKSSVYDATLVFWICSECLCDQKPRQLLSRPQVVLIVDVMFIQAVNAVSSTENHRAFGWFVSRHLAKMIRAVYATNQSIRKTRVTRNLRRIS